MRVRGGGTGRGRSGRVWGAAVLASLTGVSVAVPARAQEPLTLGEALDAAAGGAYANRIAGGEARERSSGRLRALQGILPTVRFESGLMRTTDPMAAFGVQLWQRTITEADFDPSRLNRPSVGENWTGAVVVEVPLVNPDAWLGLGAAGRAADASLAAADWQALETREQVVQAYYGAILASDKVRTLEVAVEAAGAHVRRAELMVEEGVVTRSDALLARVKAGEVEAELASARGESRAAVRRLATLLGTPDDLPTLPGRLPSPAAVRSVVGGRPVAAGAGAGQTGLVARDGSAEARLDVRAARLGLSAAQRDVRRARSVWLPRINAFGRYDWHSPDRIYRGDESWTIGVMAQWTPVAGAAHLAETRAATGRRAVAEARAEAAVANARLEAETAADRLDAALERLAIAERAVEQAVEAHRIVSARYDGGLATVVELLDASATETRTRLERAHATWTVIAEGAARALAVGGDPGRFAALDDIPTTTQSD